MSDPITKPPDGLERWNVGEALTARKLNRMVDGIRGLAGGVPSPQQIRRPRAFGGATGAIEQFRYKAMHGDYVDCVAWDGETEGVETVEIAKPYLLRRTPFDGLARDGIGFDYTTDVERLAFTVNDEVTQIVIPFYVVDDVLYAAGGEFKIGGIAFDWLDINADARYWARRNVEA